MNYRTPAMEIDFRQASAFFYSASFFHISDIPVR